MAYLNKDKTMTKAIGNDGGMYQLARHGAFNVQAFGPAMTLAQAQGYQADMLLANVHVLVVRLNAQ
jgi:hypothetical protein